MTPYNPNQMDNSPLTRVNPDQAQRLFEQREALDLLAHKPGNDSAAAAALARQIERQASDMLRREGRSSGKWTDIPGTITDGVDGGEPVSFKGTKLF